MALLERASSSPWHLHGMIVKFMLISLAAAAFCEYIHDVENNENYSRSDGKWFHAKVNKIIMTKFINCDLVPLIIAHFTRVHQPRHATMWAKEVYITWHTHTHCAIKNFFNSLFKFSLLTPAYTFIVSHRSAWKSTQHLSIWQASKKSTSDANECVCVSESKKWIKKLFQFTS